MADVTLEPKGAFKDGNVGELARPVKVEWVVSALPQPRGRPNRPEGVQDSAGG